MMTAASLATFQLKTLKMSSAQSENSCQSWRGAPIICELLGAPRQDWQLFSDWADDIFKVFNWNVANDAAVIMAAFDELDAYIDDMVAYRRRNLTDDVISELIRAEDDGDRLSAAELRMLAEALLMAGTDTT